MRPVVHFGRAAPVRGTLADVRVDEQAVVELTRALVRVRSVHDPAAGTTEAAAADVVVEAMRAFG